MKKLKNFAKTLWQDESGQGTAEYVLLVAIVVGALVVFGPALKKKLLDKWANIESDMDRIQ